MPAAATLPATLFAYIWKLSARHQAGLCVLSVTVFALSAAPLELQRRIVNDAIGRGAVDVIFWLALAYAAVALLEGAVKLCLNIYRSWVSEVTVRKLRKGIGALTASAVRREDGAAKGGNSISMILSESEPIGGFSGVSISEPLLQGGILVSVFGYLTYLHPWMALLSIAVFSPQLVFVPLMQGAINRRAEERIHTLRRVSGGIVGASARDGVLEAEAQEEHIHQVYRLNMGIFKLKFSMHFLMNLLHHLGVATVLGVGGWYAVQGKIEVGTVVAFVSGLAKVNDPWSDLINWYREMAVVRVRYRLLVEAVHGLGQGEPVQPPPRAFIRSTL